MEPTMYVQVYVYDRRNIVTEVRTFRGLTTARNFIDRVEKMYADCVAVIHDITERRA